MEKQAQWQINPNGWRQCSRCGYVLNGPSPLYDNCPGCKTEMTSDEPITFDRETLNHIHGLISLSLKDLKALPSSYLCDVVQNRLTQIGQILVSASEK